MGIGVTGGEGGGGRGTVGMGERGGVEGEEVPGAKGGNERRLKIEKNGE